MTGPGQGYTNGDGNYHDSDRRDQWYNNKELFEKMETMAQQFNGMEKLLIRFENKFERYNGLHDKIHKIEVQPCEQKDTILDLSKVVQEISNNIKQAESIKEYKYKKAAYVGTIVGIVGGVLGILALLGVLH